MVCPRSVNTIACLAMLGAFGLSAMSAMQLLALEPGPGRVIDQHLYTWIAAGSFTATTVS